MPFRRRALFWSTLLLTGLGVAAAGCPGGANSCKTESDCFKGQVCREGRCVAVDATTGADTAAGDTAGETTGPDGAADTGDATAADTSVDDGGRDGGSDTEVSDTAADGASDTGGGDAGGDADACQATTYYRDGDGDGYGDPGSGVTACSPPAVGTWVENDEDCDDEDPNINPDHVDYHTDPHPTVEWDYNCNGTRDKQWNGSGACRPRLMDGCNESKGWKVKNPDCGEAETWVLSCSSGSCSAETEQRFQACR